MFFFSFRLFKFFYLLFRNLPKHVLPLREPLDVFVDGVSKLVRDFVVASGVY